MTHVKLKPQIKEEAMPVADSRHHSQSGLPPLQLQQQQQRTPQHYPAQRASIYQHHQQPHPQSPHHHSQPSHHPASGQYASPQIPSHSLPGLQQPYIAPLHAPIPGPPDSSYYAHPSPYSANSVAGSYSSPEHTVDQAAMATAMNSRYQAPGFYATPPSQSPASVQSPSHDQFGRPLQYPHMYGQLPHSASQQSPYAQHAVAHAPGPIHTGYMSQPPGHAMSQHPAHPATPALTASPAMKLQQTPLQRQQTVMSPTSQTPSGPPSGTPGLHTGPMSGNNSSSTAAPGPIPATTPLVVRQDGNGVQWIAFEYSRDRVKMEYTIRCDVESVDVNALAQDFKTENCVYPRACCPKDQYKGNRLHYESECNTVGWALAQLNPCLRGKRGLIQRAVDSWRNSNQDPRLRSRRVRRQAKLTSRQKVAAAQQQHGAHLAGPSAPPPSAGMVAPGMSSAGLPSAAPRQQPMSMAAPQLLHHSQSGGSVGGPDDVSGMFHHM